MIVFLLLIIIAILLFGSSVVLRGFGMVLGFIALMLAIAVGLSIAQQIPHWFWWMLGLVIGGAVIILVGLGAYQQARLHRDLADIQTRADAEIASLRGPIPKFYNDGLNKKKRKQIARRLADKSPPSSASDRAREP